MTKLHCNDPREGFWSKKICEFFKDILQTNSTKYEIYNCNLKFDRFLL